MSSNKIKFTANYRRNYVAFLAVLLFIIIVVGEVVLAITIPVAMKNEDLMSDEADRIELLNLFDHTRAICGKISGKNQNGEDDSVLLMEKQLLSDTLDNFARYMREEGEKLTPEEVREIKKVLLELYRAAVQLSKGKRFSHESRIDTSSYINALLKKTREEDSHGSERQK